MKSKSHKSYKVANSSIRWMDGLSIAHGSYVDQKATLVMGHSPALPVTIFLVNQAPTTHLKPFLVTSDLLWLPLVTSGHLFLHGTFPIWFELAVVLLLANLLHPNFDLKYMMSKYIKDFSWEKMAQIRQILNYQSLMMTSRR